MDFRIFKGRILGFKVLGFGLSIFKTLIFVVYVVRAAPKTMIRIEGDL